MEELFEQSELALHLQLVSKTDLDNWHTYGDLYLFYEHIPEQAQLQKQWRLVDNSVTRMLNCGIRTSQPLTLYHGSTVPLKEGITNTVIPFTPNLQFARNCGEFIYQIWFPIQTLCFPIRDPKTNEIELLLGRGNLSFSEVNNIVIFNHIKYLETVHVVMGTYQSLDHYEMSIVSKLSKSTNFTQQFSVILDFTS
jgi:hypothetical protein